MADPIRLDPSMQVARKPGKGPAADWDLPRPPGDPLAAALAVCLRLRGADVGHETLVAGLALPPDGRMTPVLARQAAEIRGHRAKLVRRAVADLTPAFLPAVLFLKGRDACVLADRTPEGACRVFWPMRGDGETVVDAAALEDVYAGHALLLRRDTEAETARETDRQGHWFWSIVGRFWPDYAQVAAASALVNLLALATPIFTMNVYDRVFPNAAVTTLWSLAAGVGVALLFDNLLKMLRNSIVDEVGRVADQAISARIFRHVADLRLDQPGLSPGQATNTLKDYEQIRDFFSSQTVATLTDLVFALLFLAVIAYLGGPLVLPPAIALAVVLVVCIVIAAPLRRASASVRQSGGTKNAVAVETLSDLETLKAVAGQSRMQARWEREAAHSARTLEHSRRLANRATSVAGLAQQFSQVSIVVLGVYLALEGTITMGAVIAAMILSGRALAPTAALTGLAVRGSFAMSTLKSLNQIMSLPSDSDLSDSMINASVDAGQLGMENVALKYPGAEVNALEGVTLNFASGERIGIIGTIGAGKTSLVRLLGGLYGPSEGMVTIDGQNMRQIPAARLRREIQLVPQDAILYSGTLAENIAFGQPLATGDDVLEVARITGVDRIAAAHPQGFAMPISERGRNLSGGQRQLVALARALIARPRVLILDEPTSSMDSQNEKLFIERLRGVLAEGEITLIVSTHRMSLLDLVDRLVLVDKGRVVQNGPKAHVIAALNRRPVVERK